MVDLMLGGEAPQQWIEIS